MNIFKKFVKFFFSLNGQKFDKDTWNPAGTLLASASQEVQKIRTNLISWEFLFLYCNLIFINTVQVSLNKS